MVREGSIWNAYCCCVLLLSCLNQCNNECHFDHRTNNVFQNAIFEKSSMMKPFWLVFRYNDLRQLGIASKSVNLAQPLTHVFENRIVKYVFLYFQNGIRSNGIIRSNRLQFSETTTMHLIILFFFHYYFHSNH